MTDEPIIHVAYAEDHTTIRKGVIAILHEMGGIQVDIDAADGEELLRQIEKATRPPDVCLLDISMPGMNGFETTMELQKRWPEIGVLAFTAFDLEIYVIKIIIAGAKGYLFKNCDPKELKKAIATVYNNGFHYTDVVTRTFVNEIIRGTRKLPVFTSNELTLLKYSCSDLSYQEIAGKMGISSRTVEGIRDNLFKKVNNHSRMGLALFAIQFGIVSLQVDMEQIVLNKKNR